MEETTPSSQSTCPVCLRRLKRCRVGKPENCGHLFCFTCIFEWAKNVNTCPVDRIKFNTVHVFTHVGGKCIQKVDITDSSLAEMNDDSNDITYCEVCHEHTREDRLLLCDGCDKGYHLDCLRPPLSEVPDGDWYCSVCEPIIMAQYMVTSSSEEESDSCSAVVVNCKYTSSYESFSDSGSSFEPKWGRNRRVGTQLQILDSSSSESEGVILLAQLSKGKRAYRLMLSESGSNEDSDESDDSLITQSRTSKRSRRNVLLDLDEEESSQDSKINDSDFSQDPCSSSSDLLRDTHKVLPQARGSRRNELAGCNSDYPSSDLCRDSDSFVARRQDVPSKELICDLDDDSSSVVEDQRRRPGKVRLLDAPKRSTIDTNSYSAEKAAEIVTSAAQKHDQLPASSDVDDDASIHSGYYSNYEGKSPGEIELDLSSTTMSATVVESDIYSDYAPKDVVISQSTGSVQERRTQRGRSERNGGVVKVGVTPKEEGHLNVKTLKVTGNGSKMSKPKTKLYAGRKRGRRGRGPKSTVQKGKRKRVRKRQRRRRWKIRRTIRRTADSDDPGDSTYVPPLRFAPALRAAHRRFTRARTAATHSPHNNLIRAAVIAAHKHGNKEEGLHRAQAVMRQRRESLQNTPFRTSATAILCLASNPSSLRNITTPTSGYSTPQHIELPKKQEYNTPLSALSNQNGRTAPRRCSSGLASSTQQSNSEGLPPAHIADGKKSQGPKVNLMSDIFRNLDDLQNTNNTIRRDGTVVPVRCGSSPQPDDEKQLPTSTEVHCTHSEAESIVKKVLKPFYSNGDITPHEYGRILQRATKKVHQQFGPINHDRVNRLVVEYVQGYQESRRQLADP